MRMGTRLTPLVVIAWALGAHAQPGQQPSKEGALSPGARCCGRVTGREVRACGEAWFKDWVNNWNKGTHMSKQDYARTCRRVVENRVKALVEQRRTEDAQKRTSAGQRP